jgi:hypothetical protein
MKILKIFLHNDSLLYFLFFFEHPFPKLNALLRFYLLNLILFLLPSFNLCQVLSLFIDTFLKPFSPRISNNYQISNSIFLSLCLKGAEVNVFPYLVSSSILGVKMVELTLFNLLDPLS